MTTLFAIINVSFLAVYLYLEKKAKNNKLSLIVLLVFSYVVLFQLLIRFSMGDYTMFQRHDYIMRATQSQLRRQALLPIGISTFASIALTIKVFKKFK